MLRAKLRRVLPGSKAAIMSAWNTLTGGGETSLHTHPASAITSGTLAINRGGTNASTAAGARTNLGSTTVGDAVFVAASQGAAQTALGLVPGTDVQAYDATLAAVAGVTTAADKIIYFTGIDAAAAADLSAFGRTLIDDADASAARTTLGLGTIATQDANNVNISGGAVSGITDLAVADGGTGASTAPAALTNLGITSNVEVPNAQNMMGSPLPVNTSALLGISGKIYWVYVGKTLRAMTPLQVYFHTVAPAGAGAQTAEVAIATSSSAPNGAAMTITTTAAVTGTITSLTSTGLKTNTTPFATSIPAGSHVWVGVRTAMATTQPSYVAHSIDMTMGMVLVTTGAAAIAASTAYTGTVIALATGATCPVLRLTMFTI